MVVPLISVPSRVVGPRLTRSPLQGGSKFREQIGESGRSSFGKRKSKDECGVVRFAAMPRNLSGSFFLPPIGLCFRTNRCDGRETSFELDPSNLDLKQAMLLRLSLRFDGL
jgi:hypothetical protein